MTVTVAPPSIHATESTEFSLADLARIVRQKAPWLIGLPVITAVAAYVSISLLVAPSFTSRTAFIPPSQGQSGLSSALAALGPLASLTGVGGSGARNPSDQYVTLMQSTTIQDRLIDRFGLQQVYDVEFRAQARKALRGASRHTVGRKDGMVTVEVDDVDPQRAAALANAYVEELRSLVSRLAISEAKQRRMFFEEQLQDAQSRLTKAQIALQSSGVSQAALRAEPRAAMEEYARVKAEVTAATIRLQTLRAQLNESAPEVRHAQSVLNASRDQLSRLERAQRVGGDGDGTDYVSKYREFKYQETLFDLFARQYEIARVDESREGTELQIVDVAAPAELPSGPRRVRLSLLSGAFMLLATLAAFILRERRAAASRRVEPATPLHAT